MIGQGKGTAGSVGLPIASAVRKSPVADRHDRPRGRRPSQWSSRARTTQATSGRAAERLHRLRKMIN